MARTTENPTAATETTSELIEGVGRVDLRVQDIDRALEFYRDIVGLEVTEREAERALLSPSTGSAIIGLEARGVTGPAEITATGLFHTAIRYPDRPTLGEALRRLAEAGYAVGAGDHGVSEALYIDDPDGNGVELYHDRPRDQWPPPRPGELVGMFTAPVDLDDLLTEGRAGNGTPAPEGTVVGHVHLQVGSLAGSVDFYTTVLGLDRMASLGDQAAFVSSHGYHHHVGMNTWRSRGRSLARRDRAGLERVVFDVADKKQLKQTRERLVARGHDAGGDDRELIVMDPDGVELRFSLRA